MKAQMNITNADCNNQHPASVARTFAKFVRLRAYIGGFLRVRPKRALDGDPRSQGAEAVAHRLRYVDGTLGLQVPVARHSVELMTARATQTPGIMHEDRIAMLGEARQAAVSAIQRFSFTVQVFSAYCEVGFALFKLTGTADVFDDAMHELREAETRIGGPLVSEMIRNFESPL